MDITYNKNGMLISAASEFNLDQTLDCGQCFRFDKDGNGSWHGVAGGRAVTMRDTSDGILLEGVTPDDGGFWKRYFDLERDYAAIRQSYLAHPALSPCAEFAPGIRILRQNAWETLVSFIISQNNNIKRIKGIVARLCALFGEPIGDGEYTFPAASVIAAANEDALAPLRAGWRAGYILDAARRVHGGEVTLDDVAKLPLDEAQAALRVIHGVGPKVADCVLLFGMGRMEAFPMDVWMKRAIAAMFPGHTAADFGEYAGIAQQYIFHYARMNPEMCKTL